VRVVEGDIVRFRHDAFAIAARLGLVVGSILDPQPITAAPSALPSRTAPEEAALLEIAFASRPDMRGSELAIEAAGERARWQKSRVVALTGILDANGRGTQGFEVGPGIGAEIFALDRNSGNRLRVEAELEQASRRYVAIRHQIVSEVRDARIRYEEARTALIQWRDGILPPLEEAARRTERAFAAGDVSRLLVLESTTQLVQARKRYIDIQWSLRRARAELERAVGRRIELT